MSAPADPVGGGAAQRAAEAELRHGEYHHEPSLLTRAVHWIGDRLASLFSAGSGSHAFLLVLFVLVLVVAVLAVRAGLPSRTARRAATADPLAPAADTDHRALALQLTAQGRRAEALREWLRAAVRTIEERGVLPPRPGRTGAATAREAGPQLPSAAAELAAATSAFDEIWFGGRSATDSDVAHGRAAAEAVGRARIADATAPPGGIAVPW